MLATFFLALIATILCKLVVWARSRASGAYVLGALFSPFMGVGDVVDPDFRIVNETKRVKEKEEDDSGDPPNAQDTANFTKSGGSRMTGAGRKRTVGVGRSSASNSPKSDIREL